MGKAVGSRHGLGLLSAAAILCPATVIAFTSSSGCVEDCLGDGFCDAQNNNAECGYDSGDCCACTCVDTSDFPCGVNGFTCLDPEAPCVNDDDLTSLVVENCNFLQGVGDGFCDRDNNNEECAYDGGDCCSCTCEHPVSLSYDQYSCSQFFCIDPEAPCVDDDDITVDMVDNCGSPESVGDGFCDQDNNNPGCAYDEGDCCSCTCTFVANGWNDDACSEFACIDPEAPCVDDDDVTAEMVESCGEVDTMGDGFCDLENNNAGCGYDGGDCCPCTCTNEDWDDDNGCKAFACIDPEAACEEDDDFTVEMVANNCGNGRIRSIGDGYCDEINNTEQCNYDGGDCCECTCEPGPAVDDDWYYMYYLGSPGCSGPFACIDPEAPCVNDDDITVDIVANCDSTQVGNGYCTDQHNNAECGYDGGDCCECTCTNDAGEACGEDSWFACIDPEAPCVNDDDFTVDMMYHCGWIGRVGNGFCNLENNNAECAYDGGDCCECTCVPDTDDDDDCTRFACIDPNAECVDDDDITVELADNCGLLVMDIGDGYCDPDNNNEECRFDGGDCCSCTCEHEGDDDWRCSYNRGFDCQDTSAPCYGEESTLTWVVYPEPDTNDDDSLTLTTYDDDDESMSYSFGSWEQVEPLPTVEGAVEVSTKTEVGVSATAYDTRPGAQGGEPGCGEVGGDGCTPVYSRDGITSEIESRWSCARKLVEDDGPCIIEYTFGEPQDIVDIQVAFWKGEERTRMLNVHFDDVLVSTHESYAGSTFNTLGVAGTGVTTVLLESAELLVGEWISLLEVMIFVTPS